MKGLILIVLVGSVCCFAGGCQESKTPEQIEAAKYPQTPPLTPEEEAKGRELSKTLPPSQ